MYTQRRCRMGCYQHDLHKFIGTITTRTTRNIRQKSKRREREKEKEEQNKTTWHYRADQFFVRMEIYRTPTTV